MPKLVILLLSTVLGSLCGCTSYEASQLTHRDLSSVQRFFVQSNFDDNHAIAQRLADALREKGREAQFGPATLRPENAQVVILYRDYWTWDFKNHMVGLIVTVRDAHTGEELAEARFTGPTAMNTTPDEVTVRLIGDLLKPPAPAKAKS